jgi:hypothetical protein
VSGVVPRHSERTTPIIDDDGGDGGPSVMEARVVCHRHAAGGKPPFNPPCGGKGSHKRLDHQRLLTEAKIRKQAGA